MEKEKKNKRKVRTWIIIYLVLVFVLLVIIYGLPKIFTFFVDSYTATYDSVMIGENAECLVFRNETVEEAGRTGDVVRLEEPAALIKKGTPVVSVSGANIKSEMTGLVSYKYDGLEQMLSLQAMDEMTLADFRRYKGYIETEGSEYFVKEMKTGTVYSSEPIFKIIDNYNWYMVTFLPHGLADNFTEGKQVTVEFKNGQSLSFKVESKTAEELYTKVIFSTSRYMENLDELRLETIKLVSKNVTGIVLETSSIIEVDGEKGVYVINKVGNTVFKRIKILGVSGDKTIVEKSYFLDKDGKTVSTVKNYDTVKRIK